MALFLTLLILLLVGGIASNFIGRKLVGWGDALVRRIPVVRSIYSSVKQVSDTVFSDSGNAFARRCWVQWPREGVWTVAFVTGQPSGEVAALLRDEYVSVFVPTTPNPPGLLRAGAQERVHRAGDECGCGAQNTLFRWAVAPPDLALIEESKQTTLSHP